MCEQGISGPTFWAGGVVQAMRLLLCMYINWSHSLRQTEMASSGSPVTQWYVADNKLSLHLFINPATLSSILQGGVLLQTYLSTRQELINRFGLC